MIKLRFLGLSSLWLLLMAMPAWSQVQSQSFSNAQLSALKSVNKTILVPSYLPDGFTLNKVEVDPCKSGIEKDGCGYHLIYRDPDNICLVVYAVSGGLGGADSDFATTVTTKLFGEVTIEFGNQPGGAAKPSQDQMNQPQPNLDNFPAPLIHGNTPYYRVSTGDDSYYKEKYGCSSRLRITPSELIKVLDGLTVLK